jgi:hypothetical protein
VGNQQHVTDPEGDFVARTGDIDERRAKARQARYEGKTPSEAGATLGASKQTRSLGGKKAKKANAPLHERKGKT